MGTRSRAMARKLRANGLSLTSRLSANSGIGPRCIDESDDGAIEFLRHAHQANGFAIAFGFGHSIIAIETFLGVAALLLANHHDRLTLKKSHPPNQGRVVAKFAVTLNGTEGGEHTGDEVERVRPVRVAGKLDVFPSGQFACRNGFQFSDELFEGGNFRRGLFGKLLDAFFEIN